MARGGGKRVAFWAFEAVKQNALPPRRIALNPNVAAAKLGITRQYANRLRKAYAEEGPPCLRHGNSGRTSPLRTDPETGGRPKYTPGPNHPWRQYAVKIKSGGNK